MVFMMLIACANQLFFTDLNKNLHFIERGAKFGLHGGKGHLKTGLGGLFGMVLVDAAYCWLL